MTGLSAPRVLRFDTAFGREGCGRRLKIIEGASLDKPFTTGLRPWEKLPPLVASPPPLPRWEACHWILSRLTAPYESSSLATPASLVGLWVLSSVLHDTTEKSREAYSPPPE